MIKSLVGSHHIQGHQCCVSISTLPQLLFLMLTQRLQGKKKKEFIWNLLHLKHPFKKSINCSFKRCWGRALHLICGIKNLSCWEDENNLCFSQYHPCMLLTGHLPERSWFAWWSTYLALVRFSETQRTSYVEKLFCLLLNGMHLFEGCKRLGFVVNLKS